MFNVSIQLAVAWIIHRSQGLSLDEMVFDPSGIYKHELAYIALSHMRTKDKLYLLNPLSNSNFRIDKSNFIEMKIFTNSAE